jgi:hypothetical protein
MLGEINACVEQRMQCSQADSKSQAGGFRHAVRRRAAARAAGLLLLLAAALPDAWAERHALLIGVNEVQALPARLRLRGPANDVALMHRTLRGLGFDAARITVLAQRSALAFAPPTHAEVDQAMRRIASQVEPGDTVVLHLAGHGVQVPERPGPQGVGGREPDGLDEVFLLQDSGTWDAMRHELPRALRDDDIGAWIDTLVDRGARVFAVFDSCHAAGLAREPSSYARWRSVAGVELGVPATPPPAPPARTTATGSRTPRTDGRVLAYAARGHEPAGEEWLPKGSSLARTQVQGVFSFEVAGALGAGARTADELIAMLRQRYAAAKRVSPSPLVTGGGALFAP